MDLNPRRRLSDGLDVVLDRTGRTVLDAIKERFGHVEPDERRTKRGIPADADTRRRHP